MDEPAHGIEIRTPETGEEERACASIMAASEPWLTFGRDFAACLALIRRRDREVYAAVERGEVKGFIVLIPTGALVGFIQSVVVREDLRGRGIGTALVRFAEDRLLSEFPNVFLLCTGENTRALALYERLGYEVVGELPDFVARGHTEILMRKATAPLNEFGRYF